MENLGSATDTLRTVECSEPKGKNGSRLIGKSYIILGSIQTQQFWGPHGKLAQIGYPISNKFHYVPCLFWVVGDMILSNMYFLLKKNNNLMFPRPLELQK